jgi:D-cysteine desulfhydrase family pyridoxal phosphate-dependent enzyme
VIPDPVSLILRPTPLHRLDRLSKKLGVELWIKRDDLTGFAMGGNKGRKLEYLMADALKRGADTVVTCGSAQSNFIRQLGAACAALELKCAAAVMKLPFEEQKPIGRALSAQGGNQELDRILGVELHLFDDGDWDELYARAGDLAQRLRTEGRNVYEIPIGGSSALGAYAFTRAAVEIQAAEPFDWIVTASSSGSTQTGLAWAFHRSSNRVLGVACDPEPDIAEDFSRLGLDLDQLTGTEKGLQPSDFEIDFRFVGPGYGVPSFEGDAAITALAQSEGIFLDPIYSGKAFACLLHRLNEGSLPGRVLFWHTGGAPALFARE